MLDDFERRRRKQQRNIRTYNKTKENKMYCEHCNCDVHKYYWESHITTTKHIKKIKNQEI
jgi:hypothetical protein